MMLPMLHHYKPNIVLFAEQPLAAPLRVITLANLNLPSYRARDGENPPEHKLMNTNTTTTTAMTPYHEQTPCHQCRNPSSKTTAEELPAAAESSLCKFTTTQCPLNLPHNAHDIA